MKRLILASTITALATAAIPAHAQLGLGSIVLDPTQAAHAVTQIAQGENIIQNGVQLLQTAVQAYELAQFMASAPGGDFGAWISPSTLWILLEGTANTYGNSQPVMTAANTGAGADAAYQLASVPRTAMIPEYGTLSLPGQQQVAAIGATTDISDAVVQSSLTTIGTMRSNEIQREADLENLEAESQTTDPLQQTDLATMQRINQALLLNVREGQEANQLAQAITQHQMVLEKQQQDMIKAHFQDAQGYQLNFQTNIAPFYTGTAQGLNF
jgi:hypothetical protein